MLQQLTLESPFSYIHCRDVMAVGLYFYGLRATSAAYSAIFMNLIPIATFIIAIVLRY
jgi:drug/metabolite transporter (DMT)-like permease